MIQRTIRELKVCTKEAPMPPDTPDWKDWAHEGTQELKVTKTSEHRTERTMWCPNCHKTWKETYEL